MQQFVLGLPEVEPHLVWIQLGNPFLCGRNVLLLSQENLAHRLGLGRPASRQLLLGVGRVFLAPCFQVWQQLANVARRGLLELFDDLGCELDALSLQQRVIQQRKRLRFGVPGIGR